MIRKFAAVPGVRVVPTLILATILVGATTLQAQQTPAQQAPAQEPSAQQPPAQQPSDKPQSGQEATPGEIGSARKPKVKEYKNWVFNVGGGANLPSGTTQDFVRGGGGVGDAGVARNYSKYFGFRLDFQFDNLPLKDSALQLAQAPGATSHVYSLMLDPIINLPVTNEWGGYVLFGPGFYHRSGKLDSSTAIPGSACNSFFLWWGPCYVAGLPLTGKFLHASQNELGENFGFGVTHKINPKVEIYGEFRYLHGKHNGITTDLRPITIGVRF
ncbi:MAG TPA: outer membrane beta-barrel protein [Candidatus Sulfotelmatobacter sp.]|nr:outer membrane beta-barrel protein [Candidatus Sulfotelmatobacter sp.]